MAGIDQGLSEHGVAPGCTTYSYVYIGRYQYIYIYSLNISIRFVQHTLLTCEIDRDFSFLFCDQPHFSIGW